jgi:protein involved in polysaccharide export with SLBB domain
VLVASSFAGCASKPSRFKDKESSPVVAKGDTSPSNKKRKTNVNPDQLAPGYAIGLTSLDDRKLNGQFRIRFDGGLSLPYNVQLAKVDRMTLTELREVIREKYRPFFTGAFQIEVSLAERRVWLDVRGLVLKPGKQLVAPDAGLDELIALAGGLQPNSQASEVFVKRADGSEDNYGLARVFEMSGGLGNWSGGETVFFRPAEGTGQFRDADLESRSIKVLGEVRKPGLVLFRSDADFLYYLSRAEGPTAVADLEKIEIVRGGIPNAEAISVQWSDINEIPALQPGDVVVVRAREPSWWSDKALPVITSISSLLGTILLAVVVF